LDSALVAIRTKPTWAKGYSREAAALSALGHLPEAHSANMAAFELASSDGERNMFGKAMKLSAASLMTSSASSVVGDKAKEEGEENRPQWESQGQHHSHSTASPLLIIHGGRGSDSGEVLSDVAILDLETKRWCAGVQVCIYVSMYLCIYVSTYE
jgi:hypothetical protein